MVGTCIFNEVQTFCTDGTQAIDVNPSTARSLGLRTGRQQQPQLSTELRLGLRIPTGWTQLTAYGNEATKGLGLLRSHWCLPLGTVHVIDSFISAAPVMGQAEKNPGVFLLCLTFEDYSNLFVSYLCRLPVKRLHSWESFWPTCLTSPHPPPHL